MKKEKRDAITSWCTYISTLKKAELEARRNVPEGLEAIMASPFDYSIHIFSGIENIADALKTTLRIDTFTRTRYKKWLVFNGIIFFQIKGGKE